MPDITIYHSPKCGTSRNTLAMIRNSGAKPLVIEYLKTPPDRATLQALIAATGKPVIDAVRTKEALFTELQLSAPGVTDAQLIDAMLAHPILINRPIVVTPLGTRLCRPSELVLDAAQQFFSDLPTLQFNQLALFAEPTPGADFVLLDHLELGS